MSVSQAVETSFADNAVTFVSELSRAPSQLY